MIYDWCPYKKRRLGHRHTPREGQVNTRGEDVHLAKEMPLKTPTLATPSSQTSSFRNCQKINYYHLNYSACGVFLWQP